MLKLGGICSLLLYLSSNVKYFSTVLEKSEILNYKSCKTLKLVTLSLNYKILVINLCVLVNSEFQSRKKLFIYDNCYPPNN